MREDEGSVVFEAIKPSSCPAVTAFSLSTHPFPGKGGCVFLNPDYFGDIASVWVSLQVTIQLCNSDF